MRMCTFLKRCTKEVLRDPLNIAFGLGFPIVLLLLFTLIQSNIPVSLFEIENLTPGITVFGLSFMTLFSATLVAKDRETELLQRLYTTPLKSFEFIIGYILSILPIAIIQCIISYLVAIILGLPATINIVYAILIIIPFAIFHIALGLLCGSVFNVKQVGGICGPLITNLSAFLSGVWFDLDLVGGVLNKIANLFPFKHAVELERAMLNGEFVKAIPSVYPVCLYAVVVVIAAILLFLWQMKKQ